MLPVGEKVLVEVIEDEALKSGLIEIPQEVRDKYRDKAQEAVIIKLGPLAYLEEKDRNVAHPKEGDRVSIGRYVGYPMKNGDDKFSRRVISDVDVTLILGEDDD